MRVRRTATAALAGTALVAVLATPAGAGVSTGLTVSPNPATPGATVTITPIGACPDISEGTPTVVVEISGPEAQSFDVAVDAGTYDWSTTFTAGPAGVYTVDATCTYDGSNVAYMSATLEVEAPPVTITIPGTATTTSTTVAPTTSTTAAPAAAAAVVARPAYTG